MTGSKDPANVNEPGREHAPQFRPVIPRHRDHSGEEVCALCDGYGDVVNPGNASPGVKVTDWLPPVGCPRCGQTGKDPNP